MTNTFKNKKTWTVEQYKEQLDYLQNQIDGISKKITYLDVYNIIDTVEVKDELNVKIAGLVNNSSLVINCPTFQEGDDEYHTGDIVLKDNSGDIIHIEAQPGGVYYPTKVEKENKNITIQYKYATDVPEVNSNYPSDKNSTTDTPSETMSFSLEIDSSSNQTIYGYWGAVHHFSKYPNVVPQIQVWFVENQQPIEQVYCDFSLRDSTAEDESIPLNSYIVEDLPINTYIKVK